ncbi:MULTISPECIES: hypothetical protein [Chryseobacterium group]|jgi:hypothetical protein|uniref:AbiEi antitoxin C-terminal domain-containing protein n=7 Tax=Chryseobacterium group TaxID=2782232 RepID=A0A3N0X7X4_9FLAO|nr:MULTISPECIES: hypothetical protein [Chryseobacterium group]OJX29553.1 MAG: hypothetical protein BGO86_14415 [Chryseobacterium sp. 36-9]EFK33145.1 hypothetical protein HMPREF0204_12213 [Chryseobacterium gleum ATCC 35910]MDN4013242.1 hypothetical protein [Chryseobacterium gambrini]MDN4028956.1 hypothetical protein [Chryseobacterium gambrini]MDO3425207.1 hypothetical protein [Chryseobacterium sp. APV1]
MNFEKIVDAYIAGSPHRKALNKKEFDYLVQEISSFRKFKKLSKEISEYILQKHYTLEQDLYIFNDSNPEVVDLVYAYNKYTHFSHHSALIMHQISTIENNAIYLSEEIDSISSPKNTLTQGNIDLAFSKPQRVTKNIKQFRDKTFYFLKNQSSTTMETFINGVKVSNLEKTLIDCTVRPLYSGGTKNILNAFAMVKQLIDADKLHHHYKKLSFVYPYHQAIGFYLDNAGYKEEFYSKFLAMNSDYDFYLDYQLTSPQYNPKWRIHYNEDIIQ